MTTMMIKRIGVAALVALSGCATQSQDGDNPWPGYRTDGKGNLVKTADGHCWRTNDWAPARAVPECDVAITGVPGQEQPVQEEAAPPSAVEEHAEAVVPDPLRVEFDFDSAELSDARRAALQAWYQQVSALDTPSVEVHGYSDPLGKADYNRALAQKRAEAVAQWWQEQGGAIADLEVVGYGPDSAITGHRCEALQGEARKQCHQPDRRVMLRVPVSP